MFQSDIIYLQTKIETNVYGSISIEWTKATPIICDVQDISKEVVFKKYGLTEAGLYRQIYDHAESSWVLGEQVSYLDEQWLIVLIHGNQNKIGLSNHKYVVIRKII